MEPEKRTLSELAPARHKDSLKNGLSGPSERSTPVSTGGGSSAGRVTRTRTAAAGRRSSRRCPDITTRGTTAAALLCQRSSINDYHYCSNLRCPNKCPEARRRPHDLLSAQKRGIFHSDPDSSNPSLQCVLSC